MDSLEIITAFDLEIDEYKKVFDVPLTFAEHHIYPRPRYQVSVFRTIDLLVSISQIFFLIAQNHSKTWLF